MNHSITLRETLTSVSYYDVDGLTVRCRIPRLVDEARGDEFMIPLAVDPEECDVHSTLVEAVLRYGVKQILADAAAMRAGATTADRMARMARRAASLRDGTWGLTPQKALPDEIVFLAAVAAGRLTDTIASRQKWAGLGKKQRNAVASLADVAAQMPENGAGDAVLAGFDD